MGKKYMLLEDIPDFLRIPQGLRAAAWRDRKLTRQGSQFKDPPSKIEEAATRQLRRELAAQEEAKKAERFARLKELRQQKRLEGNIDPRK